MLKQNLLAITLFSLVLAISPVAFTQDNGGDNQQAASAQDQQSGHRRGHFDPQERTDMLTKQLNLTSDQQPKVLEILKSQQSQMESLRSDSSLSQDDRRSKMMDIRKSSDDQIRALLDAKQQKKFDQMLSRQQQWQGHHDAPPPPPGGNQNQ
jgi:periplasmic protein CpxP/Spy